VSSVNAGPYLIASDSRVFSESERPLVRALDWIVLASLSLLLIFGPLAFGAVQEWATFTLELGVAICVLLWVARELASGRLEIQRNLLYLPILLFAALVCLQLLTNHTAYWYATWRMALLWAAYAGIFFLMSQCLRRTAGTKALSLVLTAFGSLVALFAMVQQFTWNGKIYWVVPNHNGGWVYGPYVNHAHYAGFMEMLVPFPLVFALMTYWRKPSRVVLGFAALLMASTIFLSQSLGGILAFTVQMATFAILIGLRSRSRQHLLLLLMLSVLLVALVMIMSPGGITTRIARLHDPLGANGAGDRLQIAKDSLRMIAARPVLGWGLGTFPVVYPSFRSFYTNYFVNEAHNDYVQTTVETGILGLAVVCGFIVLFYRTALRRIERWRTDIRSAATLAAIVGVTGILIHSLCDFNLQIPANAALFFTLSALATGSSSRRVMTASKP
jgi:O-antigen ligase